MKKQITISIILMANIIGSHMFAEIRAAMPQDKKGWRIETIDTLTQIHHLAQKCMDHNKRSDQFIFMNQIYEAFVNDYASLSACQHVDTCRSVLQMLKKNNLSNRSNSCLAIKNIQSALTQLNDNTNFSKFSSSQNKSFAKCLSNHQMNPNDTLSLIQTIDHLSGLVQYMLDQSVRLTEKHRSDREHLKQIIHHTAQQCIQAGTASGHSVLNQITTQFISIGTESTKQLFETIHFLDYTLWLLTCFKDNIEIVADSSWKESFNTSCLNFDKPAS